MSVLGAAVGEAKRRAQDVLVRDRTGERRVGLVLAVPGIVRRQSELGCE